MFGLDLLILNGIKNLAIFTGTLKEGLIILTGIITYSISAVKVERRNNE
ncbi:hypothetical protein [Clostridium sp. UBA4395]